MDPAGLLIPLLSATLASAPMGATPPAPGAPRFVQLVAVDGLPPDSLSERAFLEAFRGAFAESQLPTEAPAGDGTWDADTPIPNRFRLLEGDAADDTWTLDVRVGAPAPLTVVRRSASGSTRRLQIPGVMRTRGMSVAFTAQQPDPFHRDPPPGTERLSFVLGTPADSTGGQRVYLGSGYKFSWEQAGRAAGLLALETLHHQSGDLDGDERLAIAPAIRTTFTP